MQMKMLLQLHTLAFFCSFAFSFLKSPLLGSFSLPVLFSLQTRRPTDPEARASSSIHSYTVHSVLLSIYLYVQVCMYKYVWALRLFILYECEYTLTRIRCRCFYIRILYERVSVSRSPIFTLHSTFSSVSFSLRIIVVSYILQYSINDCIAYA